MVYYYYDANGVYIGNAESHKESLPPDNCLLVEPPNSEGLWPVLNSENNGWDLVEDHRGVLVWHKDSKGAGIYSDVGPIPKEYTKKPMPKNALRFDDTLGEWVQPTRWQRLVQLLKAWSNDG